MNHPAHPKPSQDSTLSISAALIDLRDALLNLSLSLKDWQFEVDLQRRHEAQDEWRHLLEKITRSPSPHGPEND